MSRTAKARVSAGVETRSATRLPAREPATAAAVNGTTTCQGIWLCPSREARAPRELMAMITREVPTAVGI